MFESLLGETGGTIAQFVIALIVVLLLIVLIAWLVKRFGVGRFGAAHGAQAELEVITSIAVDQKRKLVLVRHGKLEHLLLIGGGSDEVIERSMVGGIPIAARIQANRAADKAPDDTSARPTSGELSSKRFADALARSSADQSKTDKPNNNINKTLAASAGLTAGGLAATAANLSDKAKAATTKTLEAAKGTRAPSSKPDPLPIEAEPQANAAPEAAAPSMQPSAQPSEQPSASTPVQNERDAIDKSLDDALSQSLLEETPKPAHPNTTTIGPSSADLEREIEAALDFDNFDASADSEAAGASSSDLPDLPDLSSLPPLPDLSSLTDDLPSEPKPSAPTEPQAVSEPKPATETKPEALDPLSLESVRASRKASEGPATSPQKDTAAPKTEPAESSKPEKEIPVELSGRTDPPIPVSIPSRGPASNATTLAKPEVEPTSVGQPVGSSTPAKTADDLDDEMRRLLGELSGDTKGS